MSVISLLNVVSLLTGGFLLVSTVCRLARINVYSHKPEWVLAYLGICVGAWVQLFDSARALVFGVVRPLAAFEYLPLMLGVALLLWNSRNTWRAGAPPFMEK